MSYPAIWVETAPVENAIERCILTLLAEITAPDGTFGVHTLDALADYAVCDNETIKESLLNLSARGLIEIQRFHGGLGEEEYVLYGLLIPREWYSDSQWDDVQEQMERYRANPESYRHIPQGYLS